MTSRDKKDFKKRLKRPLHLELIRISSDYVDIGLFRLLINLRTSYLSNYAPTPLLNSSQITTVN